jgi:hypothetical protein
MNLIDRYRGSLLCLAIGDAMGIFALNPGSEWMSIEYGRYVWKNKNHAPIFTNPRAF